MKNLIICFIALSISLFMVNCNKEELLEEDNSSTLLDRSFPSFKVSDGILYFETEATAKQAYLYLNDLIGNTINDDLMKSLEKELGHNSLYFKQSTIFRNEEEGMTAEELDAYLEEKFIQDDLRRLLLNEHYEIGVGNDVHVFQDRNVKIKILDSDNASINEVRGVEKGDGYNFVHLLSDKIVIANSDGEHTTIQETKNWVNNDGEVSTRTLSWNPTSIVDPCHILNFTYLVQLLDDGEEVFATYTVEWGDGTSDTQVGNIFSGSHTYASEGQYSPQVTAVYEKMGETFTETFTSPVEVLEPITCSNDDDDDSKEITFAHGSSKKVTGCCWYNNDILGKYAGTNIEVRHEVNYLFGGKKFIKDNSQKDLYIDISAQYRDESCEKTELKTDDKEKLSTNDWKIRVSVSKLIGARYSTLDLEDIVANQSISYPDFALPFFPAVTHTLRIPLITCD